MREDRKICVGMISGSHGVRGLLRLRSFTAIPEAISDYAPLTDETGKRRFEIEIKSTAKDFFIVQIEGVKSREDADALRGAKLFVSREKMPKTGKEEYYEADLIGLPVKDKSGNDFGSVRSIHDYGAGVFLEIGTSKESAFMLPFRDAFVPKLDLKEGLIVIDLPEDWLDQNKPTPKVKSDKKAGGAS